jgi:hypothetical protein
VDKSFAIEGEYLHVHMVTHPNVAADYYIVGAKQTSNNAFDEKCCKSTSW